MNVSRYFFVHFLSVLFVLQPTSKSRGNIVGGVFTWCILHTYLSKNFSVSAAMQVLEFYIAKYTLPICHFDWET